MRPSKQGGLDSTSTRLSVRKQLPTPRQTAYKGSCCTQQFCPTAAAYDTAAVRLESHTCSLNSPTLVAP